ncbi:lysylphosphatidylglycerol synthase transmembrane domain-containing protein [Geodermatophilus ruber]|uniref:Uncharacterized membrane protein YbhN, UPF0104 family n=1 Tax=Geodermatophilus ruber TaxID=504800 RepID=A0A1I4JYP1_9ACTN|nr:lysylphosphatidylglycerol synthase transmembrane domain-containing protein [Geodermatophilus ruber]SFL71373.1 Uncharacterized membrane protein YbhN, UPF0104 family [Geodermatophilus ruber]
MRVNRVAGRRVPLFVVPLRVVPIGMGPVVHRAGPPLLRLTCGLAVLLVLGQHLGAAPFQEGLRAVTLPAVGSAVAITVMTTVCSAWRWRVVARALGVGMPLAPAVGAYYRSQFLNSVLPGGVVGDLHRGVVHGRRAGHVGRALRAVGWERFSGQLVQAALTGIVLLALPSPVRPVLPVVLASVAGATACAALAVRRAARRGRSRLTAAARTVAGDVRHGLLAGDVWPQLMVASVLVIAGHTTTFVIAARTAGCTAPMAELVALAMLVQTAMVLPLGIGGWGLREGAAAWAFAAAGLGAATGVTVAIVYGVLSLAAVVPGAGMLLADAASRGRRAGAARSGSGAGRLPPPDEADLDRRCPTGGPPAAVG